MISGFGFLLSVSAVVVLIWYNAVHNLEALQTSLIAIVVVALFTVLYHFIKQSRLSSYMDKNLQADEEKKEESR